ncbi:PQQ-binding-like beta-propeller repeat protein [Rhodococcus sp. G-MC3]|uniref:outer membrane protein assembly factor BamB family protein n=1 Tax=Rhodococcus sp. G-MC3 TaxID=3046209 RepID=UPI0024BB655F|nr:PQQ-binding-like beta-propeller repeat protein [Rhodococcus sp. G-MC3]MDJ0394385.1 PQQ-binding-like beta-propeller repeat protein [Rhodococcus sp. G-MC3]
MNLSRSERWKLIALGAAIVVGAAVIIVNVVSTDHEEQQPATALVESSLSTAPTRSWTLDVHTLSDNGGDVLLGMPAPLETYYGYPGLLDAGNRIIVATGYPLPKADPSSPSAETSAVTLVGVDPNDGASQWRTPIGRVSSCDQQLDGDILACWDDRRIVFVDVTDGTLLSDIGTDFDLSGATLDGDVVYASGNSDGAPVLTRGTTTDLTSDFRRDFEKAPDSWIYSVPEHGVAIESVRGDGTPQYSYTVYDLETGAKKFTFEGDSLVPVGEGLYLSSIGSESGTVGTQNLLGSDGAVVRAVPIPAYNAAGYPSSPSVPSPLFLGDGAYDPKTGDELWRNPALVVGQFNGKDSAVAAVIGRTVITTDPDARTITGLDIESGRQLWQTPWEDAYWVRDGLTDGEYFVFGDYQGTHAISARDGRIAWSMPQLDGVDPRMVRVSSAGGRMLVSSGAAFTLWSS